MSDINDQTIGRWDFILPSLGIPDQYLNPRRHGPCPVCEPGKPTGRDRYRFTDHKGKGSYFCSQCGPGSGFDLLMRWHGWDFKQAADEVRRVLGINDDGGWKRPPGPRPLTQADRDYMGAFILAYRNYAGTPTAEETLKYFEYKKRLKQDGISI